MRRKDVGRLRAEVSRSTYVVYQGRRKFGGLEEVGWFIFSVEYMGFLGCLPLIEGDIWYLVFDRAMLHMTMRSVINSINNARSAQSSFSPQSVKQRSMGLRRTSLVLCYLRLQTTSTSGNRGMYACKPSEKWRATV